MRYKRTSENPEKTDKVAKPQTQKIKVKTEGPIVFVFMICFLSFFGSLIMKGIDYYKNNYAPDTKRVSLSLTFRMLNKFNIWRIATNGSISLQITTTQYSIQMSCGGLDIDIIPCYDWSNDYDSSALFNVIKLQLPNQHWW